MKDSKGKEINVGDTFRRTTFNELTDMPWRIPGYTAKVAIVYPDDDPDGWEGGIRDDGGHWHSYRYIEVIE